MNTIQKTLIVLVALLGIAVFTSLPVAAEKKPATTEKTSKTTCGGVDTAILSCGGTRDSKDLKTNGVWQLLLIVLNVLTAGVGIVAVGGLVYASILYASAADDAAQMKKAKDTIVNVVIGIVAFALMYSFLQFIIPGGVFS